MCVIAIIKDKAKAPTLADWRKMADSNRDGIGAAWAAGGRVHYRKGLKVADLPGLLARVPRSSAFVVHFRLATIGQPSAALCHPFPIEAQSPAQASGTAGRVLFHNGHWGAWLDALFAVLSGRGVKIPAGPWSDSRGLAVLTHYMGAGMLDALALPDRLAILDSRGRVKTWGAWNERRGFLVSNTHWDYTAPAALPAASSGNVSTRWAEDTAPFYRDMGRDDWASYDEWQEARETLPTEGSPNPRIMRNPRQHELPGVDTCPAECIAKPEAQALTLAAGPAGKGA